MTDKDAKIFYNSAKWQAKRIEILKRDRFECQYCIKRVHDAVQEGRTLSSRERTIKRATTVHHIKHLKDHPELALDDDNLVSTCEACHMLQHPEKNFESNRFKAKPKLTEERW